MADRSSKKIFKYPGGFIKSERFRYSEKDKNDHVYAVVWGEIIYDPKIWVFRNGKKKTEFAIRYCYGGYVIINIWGDTPAADEAAMMKAKERLIAFGTVTRNRYVNKLGEEKEQRIMHPHFIIPCDRMLDFLNMMMRMSGSPSLAKMLDEDEMDAFESAEDYIGREDLEEVDGDDGMFA